MKRFLLAALFFLFFSPCHAVELQKVVTHPNGWVFKYVTKIKSKLHPEGEILPIELPYAKCEKTDLTKSCFSSEREASRYAHTKAIAAEKMMKEALAQAPAPTE